MAPAAMQVQGPPVLQDKRSHISCLPCTATAAGGGGGGGVLVDCGVDNDDAVD